MFYIIDECISNLLMTVQPYLEYHAVVENDVFNDIEVSKMSWLGNKFGDVVFWMALIAGSLASLAWGSAIFGMMSAWRRGRRVLPVNMRPLSWPDI